MVNKVMRALVLIVFAAWGVLFVLYNVVYVMHRECVPSSAAVGRMAQRQYAPVPAGQNDQQTKATTLQLMSTPIPDDHGAVPTAEPEPGREAMGVTLARRVLGRVCTTTITAKGDMAERIADVVRYANATWDAAESETRQRNVCIQNNNNNNDKSAVAAVVTDADGQRMRICTYPVAQDLYASGALASGNIWDAATVKMLLSEMQSRGPGIMLDIGANLGSFAIPIAMRGYRVFAVEPSSQTAELLWRSVVLNGLENRVTVLQNAISDNFGWAELVVDANNKGGNFLDAKPARAKVHPFCLDSAINP